MPFVEDRAILPWRIVAAAFLHVVLPAYLLVGLGCGAVALLDGATPGALAGQAVGFSLWFVTIYGGIAVTASGMARAIDPLLRRRRRRQASGPRPQSAGRLSAALASARRAMPDPALAQLATLAAADWDHDDPRCQALTADLAQVVAVSVAALQTAPAERRQELCDLATAALGRISRQLHALHVERQKLDEGDLRTVALYIDSRYP